MTIDVRTEIKDAQLGLEALNVALPGLARSILSALANVGKKWIKARIYLYIHRKTGAIARDIKTKAKGNYATIAANPARINETLERGGVLRPSKKKYLTFVGSDGQIRRMRSVVIPAKHHFSRAAAGFDDSSEYKAAIDKGVARVIAKAGLS